MLVVSGNSARCWVGFTDYGFVSQYVVLSVLEAQLGDMRRALGGIERAERSILV